MTEYIDRAQILNDPLLHTYKKRDLLDKIKSIPTADVAPVVHGHPVSKNRPCQRVYYEETSVLDNGEPIYRMVTSTDEGEHVDYCSVCGKRLCSTFTNYCPNCGAKMDLEG